MTDHEPGPLLDLQPQSDGAILPVRAQPGARRNEVRGMQDGALKVCVTQAPEKGKANKAIVEVLAKWLGVRRSQIERISGETASQKKFLIREVSREELSERIRTRLAEDN
jgi:uncharacterized protein (TIGR00251 family)